MCIECGKEIKSLFHRVGSAFCSEKCLDIAMQNLSAVEEELKGRSYWK